MQNGKKGDKKKNLYAERWPPKTNCTVACTRPLVHMQACWRIRLLSGVAKLIYVRAELRN